MIPPDRLSKHNCFSQFFAILILPLLFMGGLAAGYLGFVPLLVEIHTLIIIAFIFLIFVLFIRHNANYAVCHMRGSFGRMETDLHEALEENSLTIMGETKSTLAIEVFISDYYKEIRNDNFARVAPSVFPMLGILGTFIAIAISMPDFTVKDLNALDQEISLLLSGIGTAFYASIYGIFLSLLWTYFEKRGASKAEKNIHDLERLYNKRIWKKSELIKHEHMQSELKDQQIVQTLKDTFNLDFIKELNEQYMKNYKMIIDDTTNSFTVLSEHMQASSMELRKTLTLIQSREESVNAVAHIKSNIESFNKSSESLHKALEHFDGTVDHTFEKIDSEVGQIVEKLADFAFMLSEQNREIQNKLQLQKSREVKKSDS
ncbi:MAG: MotA/TolQ/ExbB proton channel family protein [Campylobacterota bacterium]|nr:MotA/TolQ/ExbB proton channel family protein [Campylobacterota bacterium]